MANFVTAEGLKKMKEELARLEGEERPKVIQQIAEARDKGDLSENAEYDAAKDEQRDIEARIEELEKLLKNVEVVDVEQVDGKVSKVSFGCTVKITDLELKEDMEYTIKGASEADSLNGSISNESPLGLALIGAKKGDTVEVEAPIGVIKYKIKDIRMD